MPVFLSPLLSLLNKVLDVRFFQLLLYKSPFDVVIRCGGEVFHRLIIRSQSFNEPGSLGYDLHKCFSDLFCFSVPHFLLR